MIEQAIPKHVAIIMDGNGRWAKKRLLPRSMGHKAGAKQVEKICEAAYDLGVHYLTVYAFSTENWSRPQKEVDALMKLMVRYLKDYRQKAMKKNMRIRIIGDTSVLQEEIQKEIHLVQTQTKNNTGLQFQIAINYGGRDEIVRAIKKFITDNSKTPKDLTKEEINEFLDTREIPDPDLIIRPGGEYRLSNFLTWQSAYSELYFTPTLWPDFERKDLEEALIDYANRQRRYGGI